MHAISVLALMLALGVPQLVLVTMFISPWEGLRLRSSTL